MSATNTISAPIHGNYHGYYTKRPFANDSRLALLPYHLFKDARVLDIGCNEGWVTCEIAQSWSAKRVIGVDIDDSLVRAAWKHRRSVWSLESPISAATKAKRDSSSAPASGDTGTNGKKRKRDGDASSVQVQHVAEEVSGCSEPDYFPASCEHMFGPLPIPPVPQQSQSDTADSAHIFPHNITFQTADWVNTEISEDYEGYDVVIAFSVSKWIHLNGGDDGLMQFFRRVHNVLKPGGAFVLEPQEWDTYAKAKRMDPRLKENAKTLKIRPDDFEGILKDIGFGSAEHLGKTGEGGFRRPVDLYKKNVQI